MTKEQALLALGRAAAGSGAARLQSARVFLEACFTTEVFGDGPPLLTWMFETDETRDVVLVSINGTSRTRAFSYEEVLELADKIEAVHARVNNEVWFSKDADRVKDSNSATALQRLPARPARSSGARLVSTTKIDSVVSGVENFATTGIFGSSSTGKSTVALQAVERLALSGWRTLWWDLSTPTYKTIDLLFSLSSTGATGRHLLVLDDAQANPNAVREVAELFTECGASLSPLHILLVGWENARRTTEELFPKLATYSLTSDSILQEIVSESSYRALAGMSLPEVRRLSKGDLLVASHILRFLAKEHRLPSIADIARDACRTALIDETLSREALDALYTFACLSSFQIGIAVGFLRQFSIEAVIELTSRHILRSDMAYVSLGHASFATLVLLEVRRLWRWEERAWESPAVAAVNYLRASGDEQILQTLESLDLSLIMGNVDDQHGTTFLVRAWQSVRVLVRQIEAQLRADPGWGDNVPCVAFSALALRTQRPQLSSQCKKFVWKRWSISESQAEIVPITTASKDEGDFSEIVACMKAEDVARSLDAASPSGGSSTDIQRFHRTWLLGVLLGLESQVLSGESSRAKTLAEIAKGAQSADGSFYPKRVPWVTARVLIGLASTGASIQNSDVVKNASTWLRTPASNGGPCEFGVWEPGTGVWNTPVMTTVMCVKALVDSGVSVDDSSIKRGLAFLNASKAEWSLPGHELDAALCLEMLLSVDYNWWQLRGELNGLLDWASSEGTWKLATAPASIVHTESTKVPQICLALIDIIWKIVKSELPVIFERFSILRDVYDREEVVSTEHDIRRMLLLGDELRAEIRKNIEDRMVAGRPAPKIAAKVGLWLDRLAKVDGLLNEIQSAATNRNEAGLKLCAASLDQLGSEVLGSSWRDVVEGH